MIVAQEEAVPVLLFVLLYDITLFRVEYIKGIPGFLHSTSSWASQTYIVYYLFLDGNSLTENNHRLTSVAVIGLSHESCWTWELCVVSRIWLCSRRSVCCLGKRVLLWATDLMKVPSKTRRAVEEQTGAAEPFFHHYH